MLSVEKVDNYYWVLYDIPSKKVYTAFLLPLSDGQHHFSIGRAAPTLDQTSYVTIAKEVYYNKFWSASYPKSLISDMLEVYKSVTDSDMPVEMVYQFGGRAGGRNIKMFPTPKEDLND